MGNNKINIIAKAQLEKKSIESQYPSFKCTAKSGQLKCVGFITPTENSDTYEIEITYNLKKSPPRVMILSPEIEYNDKIHMYSDKSLCLFYPKEDPWDINKNIVDTIIPWTAEWLIYYELYNLYPHWGWLGKEVKHTGDKVNE